MTARQEDAAARFKTHIAIELGLDFDGWHPDLPVEVLVERMHEVGSVDEAHYLAHLAAQPDELDAVAKRLTVGETSFFRHPEQFVAFRQRLRAAVGAGLTKGRPLRVLSVGCATGEEPYTLAIAALSALGPQASREVTVVAIDLNGDWIAHARRGIYDRYALRGLAADTRDLHFLFDADAYALGALPRGMVSFERRNVLGPDDAFWRPGSFDFIFCRNVLIYFTPDARARSLARFALTLSAQGWLFLGPAEAARGAGADFALRDAGGCFAYERLTTPSEQTA